MSVRIACPHCHAGLKARKVPPPGKALTCPRCAREFTPASSSLPVAQPAGPAISDEQRTPRPPVALPVRLGRGARPIAIASLICVVVLAGVVTTALMLTRGRNDPDKKGTDPANGQGLNQRDWELGWKGKVSEWDKARTTGNDLVVGDKEKELQKYFQSTLREGEVLSG